MYFDYWILHLIVILNKARAFDPLIGWLLSAICMGVHIGAAYWFHNSAWVSSGGALVIVLGVLTIARRLIRMGDHAVTRPSGPVAKLIREVDGDLFEAYPEETVQRALDLKAEFQHGPSLVIVGTIINGYGGLLWYSFTGW